MTHTGESKGPAGNINICISHFAYPNPNPTLSKTLFSGYPTHIPGKGKHCPVHVVDDALLGPFGRSPAPPGAPWTARLGPWGLQVMRIDTSLQKSMTCPLSRAVFSMEVGLLSRHAALSSYGYSWSPDGPAPGMRSVYRVHWAMQSADSR